MKNSIKELQFILNYKFKDVDLLKRSLIHKSYDNQKNNDDFSINLKKVLE